MKPVDRTIPRKDLKPVERMVLNLSGKDKNLSDQDCMGILECKLHLPCWGRSRRFHTGNRKDVLQPLFKYKRYDKYPPNMGLWIHYYPWEPMCEIRIVGSHVHSDGHDIGFYRFDDLLEMIKKIENTIWTNQFGDKCYEQETLYLKPFKPARYQNREYRLRFELKEGGFVHITEESKRKKPLFLGLYSTDELKYWLKADRDWCDLGKDDDEIIEEPNDNIIE